MELLRLNTETYSKRSSLFAGHAVCIHYNRNCDILQAGKLTMEGGAVINIMSNFVNSCF